MLNNCNFMGRLTADPELKTTQSGKSVTQFSLAVERDFAPKGEKITDFINCVAWNGTADFITRYFTKGRMMSVTGSLQSRSYDNKDGKKVTVWEVIIDRAYFCGDKSNDKSNSENQSSSSLDVLVDDSDLPF